ncbi:hypothetical protein DFH08DRAFT_811824 [Mycena albidolilacea]|uniref:Uncharacterized protein n=1 Tax=Mycena albidolilacea TaxID=1033008 RepID=A0AAD7EMM6_9AGAR|nr:hypothetical protein DFH08DRAFT_811824 [Mycena albidolilacea]
MVEFGGPTGDIVPGREREGPFLVGHNAAIACQALSVAAFPHGLDNPKIKDPTKSLSTSGAVAKTTISLSVGHFDSNHWLGQANHIFSCLGISSNFEDYGTNAASSWAAIEPDRPTYWSLDPKGADPLSLEDAAANLGFPSL